MDPPTDGAAPALSRTQRAGLWLHRALDKQLTPIGVWLMRRTRGRLAQPWKVKVVLLTTRGRRSGRDRTVVLQYFPDGDAMVVVAANDGGETYPGWYLNLTATPAAVAEVEGRRFPVRATELALDEATRWWERILRASPDYERYRRATARRFPVLRLVRC